MNTFIFYNINSGEKNTFVFPDSMTLEEAFGALLSQNCLVKEDNELNSQAALRYGWVQN